MADVVVDTDVCIDHLTGRGRLSGRRSRLGYSVITRAELRAGAGNERDLAALRRLLGAMTEYPVDRRIADTAGRVRLEAGVRLPDALIAATALVHGLIVYTRNVKDFRRVSGLRVRSPR